MAEGEREAAIARAEGNKQSAILEAEGQMQSQVLFAEGERQAQLLTAEGYAQALKVIHEQARNIDNKTMALQYSGYAERCRQQPIDQIRPADGADQHGAEFRQHHGRRRSHVQWQRQQ